MSASVADFRTRFPEFADDTTYPDARIQLFLDDAAMCVDEGVYGKFYDTAVCYLAAHMLYLGTLTSSGSGGASVGPISTKTAGGVSKTYAINSLDLNDSDSYYSQSQYGLTFMSIRAKVKIPGFIVIC